MSKVTYTPMITQYLKIKEDYADAVVFFRLGDFYEMFFDDAILASKILEIQLTSRDAGTKIPMCGIPYHASKNYIQKLIDKGLKIAIAEQVSEPGKGLVERKVVRVITPGTLYEEDILSAGANNYIASVLLNELGYQLTYLDISTADAYIQVGLSNVRLIQTINDLKIKEVVCNQGFDQKLMAFFTDFNILVSKTKMNDINHPLLNQVNKSDQQGVILLFSYLEDTQKDALNYLTKINYISQSELFKVDNKAKKHLEVFESVQNTKEKTLIDHLDNTKTASGSRLLKHYLNNPLTNLEELTNRHLMIEGFINNFVYNEQLGKLLNQTYDISRILGRVIYNSASPRDLYHLKKSLNVLPELKNLLNNYEAKSLINTANKIDLHNELVTILDEAINELPPITLKDGGVIKSGFNKRLDELRDLKNQGGKWLSDFEAAEKERTGIKNLKVGYSKNYGYYIEISKAQSLLLPDDSGYERKQTLVNNERYISPVLKEKEDDLLHAEESIITLEQELFNQLKTICLNYQYSLLSLSQVLSSIDVFLNFANLALKYKYVKPELSLTDRRVIVKEGRHPVVEQYTTFVNNDVDMNQGEIFMITGPNMSGKSTYMRMYALIVYLAQIGSYVPATYAKLPIYDALYTRIGSSDDLSGGKSTFMVEMLEANEALNYATNNSLIIFDEIGRGTATFDGMALASAIIEYIYTKIGAQTFFSTHYHEITSLANKYEYITNLHVKALAANNQITFLHKIKPGSTDRSYGVLVAKLANLPEEVILRSQKTLKQLEDKRSVDVDLFNYLEDTKNDLETNYFNLAEMEVVNNISSVDLNQMSPLDALNWLSLQQKTLKSNKGGE